MIRTHDRNLAIYFYCPIGTISCGQQTVMNNRIVNFTVKKATCESILGDFYTLVNV